MKKALIIVLAFLLPLLLAEIAFQILNKPMYPIPVGWTYKGERTDLNQLGFRGQVN